MFTQMLLVQNLELQKQIEKQIKIAEGKVIENNKEIVRLKTLMSEIDVELRRIDKDGVIDKTNKIVKEWQPKVIVAENPSTYFEKPKP